MLSAVALNLLGSISSSSLTSSPMDSSSMCTSSCTTLSSVGYRNYSGIPQERWLHRSVKALPSTATTQQPCLSYYVLLLAAHPQKSILALLIPLFLLSSSILYSIFITLASLFILSYHCHYTPWLIFPHRNIIPSHSTSYSFYSSLYTCLSCHNIASIISAFLLSSSHPSSLQYP